MIVTLGLIVGGVVYWRVPIRWYKKSRDKTESLLQHQVWREANLSPGNQDHFILELKNGWVTVENPLGEKETMTTQYWWHIYKNKHSLYCHQSPNTPSKKFWGKHY